MPQNVLLLSIQPEYAKKIFAGTKTVELRRVRPRLISDGDRVLVYASSPEKALVGFFEVQNIIEESPNKLWSRVQKEAGITRQKFDSYYKDASTGVGIFLINEVSFNKPVKLEIIRERLSSFRPPQSFRYLKPNEIDIIESIGEGKLGKFLENSSQDDIRQLALL